MSSLASTGESLININNDGTLAGNQLPKYDRQQHQRRRQCLEHLRWCRHGAAYRGPLTAILVFLDDAANVPATLVIDNNAITNVQQGGTNLDMANTAVLPAPSVPRLLTTASADSGGGACSRAIAGVGIDAVTVQSGIRVERRRNNFAQLKCFDFQ